MNKKFLTILLILSWISFSVIPDTRLCAEERSVPRLGVWITVFSPEKILYSRENVHRLIASCKESGIGDIYLQVYRADKAYYDSGITDRSPHDSIVSEAKEDLIEYLINMAHRKGIKVHAWLNCLSIAQNIDSNIVKKFGDRVLITDQHGRTPLRKGNKDELDKYYIRENQLFLEAGDPVVRKYVTSVASEVLKRYPGFDGLHLDYIRYPSAVPFIPGSRFASHGLSYGYEEINMNNFKAETGLDVKKMSGTRANFSAWDKWRRDQITSLVRSLSRAAKQISPEILVSATIVSSVERTYMETFQHWTLWLKEGLVDYVVAMNYTDDRALMELRTGSVMLPGYEDKVQVGIGPYLMKKNPAAVEEQINSLFSMSVPGIVLFSYDEVASDTDLQDFLSKKFNRE